MARIGVRPPVQVNELMLHPTSRRPFSLLNPQITCITTLLLVVAQLSVFPIAQLPPSNGSIRNAATALVGDSVALELHKEPHQAHQLDIIGPSLTSSLQATMPQTPSTSTTTTFLLCFLLLISFFPGLFHSLWTLPFALFGLLTPSPSPKIQTLSEASTMSWFQKQFTLPAKSRGSYLITDQVVSALPEIRQYKIGLLHLFVQHTSCALSLNENCKSVDKPRP